MSMDMDISVGNKAEERNAKRLYTGYYDESETEG